MNARVVLLRGGSALVVMTAVVWLAIAAAGRGAPGVPEPPSAVLRVVDGSLGRFDRAQQGYVPVARGTVVGFDEPLQSGETEATVQLPAGGVLVAMPHTAFARIGTGTDPTLRIRLDEGRIWLNLKAEEPIEVSSFHTRVCVARGAYEVVVYKDADHYINTVVRAWRGRGRLFGGERLQVERPLAPGLTARVDDVRVHPVTRFDVESRDAWQNRMLALP